MAFNYKYYIILKKIIKMSTLGKFLKSIDLMGREFKFKIDGNNFTTPIGGFITFLVLCGTFIFTWYFGYDIIYKENPNTLKNDNIFFHSPFYDINRKNFFLSFRVEDNDGKMIVDEKFIKYEFRYYRFSFNKEKGSYQINQRKVVKPKRCEDGIIKEEIFQKRKIANYFCSDIDYTLGGSWNEDKVSFIQYLVIRCKNSTENNNNCLSDEQVRKKYGTIYLDTIYLNNLVNPKNYKRPLINNYQFRFTQLELNKINKQHFYFNTAEITTDSGFMFRDWDRQKFLQFDHQRDGYSSLDKSGELYQLSIYLTHKIESYERSYIKIPSIAARVGGIMNLALLVINKLWDIYLDNEYNVYMMAHFFKLEVEDDEADMKSKKGNNFFKFDMSEINGENKFDNSEMRIEKIVELKKIKGKDNEIETIMKNPFEERNMNIEYNMIKNRQVSNIIEFKKKPFQEISISKCKRISFKLCCFESTWRDKKKKL